LRIGDSKDSGDGAEGENGCDTTQYWDAPHLEIFGVTNPSKHPPYLEACGLRHLAFKVGNFKKLILD